MAYYRDKVVNIIKSWLGKNESDGSFRVIIDKYNSITPLPVGYKVKYTDEWCAATYSAVFHEAGYDAICPSECSCNRMIDKAKSMGIWVENDAYVPNIGDAVIYDWEDNGAGDNVGFPDHIGMVVAVGNGKIKVIEGNYGGAVRERVIDVNGRYIRGFVTPKFTATAEAKPIAPSKKSNEEIAKEVWAGKWGSGAERKARLEAAGYDYAAIQAIVNKGGSVTSPQTQAKKSNEEVAKEVIRGNWGSGAERKRRLTEAGYDYAAIQTLVNSMMK